MKARRKAMWNAQRIKALRNGAGKTQEEFCELVGVAVWTLRAWEQGRVSANRTAELLLDRLKDELNGEKVRELQPA